MLDAQAVAPTAGEGGAMDDGVGGTEEAEQELLAALTPVEDSKATDAESPPTWIGTGFQRKLGPSPRALAALARAVEGIVALLGAVGIAAARLRAPAYRERVEANTKAAEEA